MYREYEWPTVSVLKVGLFLCLFPELQRNDGTKHKNNTHVGAETVRDWSTCIISFLTRQNVSINDDKNDDLYTSHSLGLRTADDVTIDCWWRHNNETSVAWSRE